MDTYTMRLLAGQREWQQGRTGAQEWGSCSDRESTGTVPGWRECQKGTVGIHGVCRPLEERFGPFLHGSLQGHSVVYGGEGDYHFKREWRECASNAAMGSEEPGIQTPLPSLAWARLAEVSRSCWP